MSTPLVTDIAIIGAGTAGITAFKELGRLGVNALLIDHGPLGTTCARVGCMPSKAVLHAAHQWSTLHTLLKGTDLPEGASTADELWLRARDMRDLLASSTATHTRSDAGERLIMGRARFTSPETLDVDGRQVRAKAFIVATGSRPIIPGFLAPLGDRLLTTDSLFDLDRLPQSLGLLGLGAVGLEMGLALARLGVRVVAGDMKALPAGISDPLVGARAIEQFSGELTMWLGTALDARLGAQAIELEAGNNSAQVELVLAALGRQPNVEDLALDLAGAALDERGQPILDPGNFGAAAPGVFLAGDVNGIRPLQHEAADEGVIVARAAAQSLGGRSLAPPQRSTPLAIVFSNPDIASVGLSYDGLDLDATVIGTAQGSGNGRARIMGAEGNLLRLYAERASGRLLGASLIASHGEHLAHLLAWAIQRGETVEDLLGMPYYHPTTEEMVRSALRNAASQLAQSP